MTTRQKLQATALPARMRLVPEALDALDIAVLPLPFYDAITRFRMDIERVLSRGRGSRPITPPLRRFNTALLACAPTLTHGFEWVGGQSDRNQVLYRALAVGTPNSPLLTPQPSVILQQLRLWAQQWTQEYTSKPNSEAESAARRFLTSITTPPEGWGWQSITPGQLAADLSAERGLGYNAIPSLLATLLHGRTSVINAGGDRQILRWRKAHGGGFGRVGLFVVSQPFKAGYVDQNGHEREGYFAYRLDFHVETQTGRLNEHDKLDPWIFMHLSCQRYAHERLQAGNYGRDVSILVGMHEARLPGVEIDTTLVRLTADLPQADREGAWSNQVVDMLAAFQARDLVSPRLILDRPECYGNFGIGEQGQADEYYVVHAEGYEYGEATGRGHGHSVKTGYSLRERGDVMAQVLSLLAGVIEPDGPLRCDVPAPAGVKMPMAMRDYAFLSRHNLENIATASPQARERIEGYRRISAVAIQRALAGETMQIAVIWREQETRDAVLQQLREALRLQETDDFPPHVTVTTIHIDDPALLKPLDTAGVSSKEWTSFEQQLRREHQAKCQSWRSFLQRQLPPRAGHRFAIIELGRRPGKGFHPKQSIYGPVRNACALEHISSQMIRTVTAKANAEGAAQDAEPTFTPQTSGRVQNAVLDMLLRQTGAQYGLPFEVYERASIPTELAGNMDVVALCRRRTDRWHGDIHYALAVRLCATGAVEVLLPSQQQWISYAAAGHAVGRVFAQARSDIFARQRVDSNLKLSGSQLAEFAARVALQPFQRPTLLVVEAEGWRNERGEEEDSKVWPQLKNEHLAPQCDVLNFAHVPGHGRYLRDDPRLNQLLGVVRLRSGKETPQYLTSRSSWDQDGEARDFTLLSGFYDEDASGILHYFSVGRLPRTQRRQDTPGARGMYKLGSKVRGGKPRFDEYGADISFKHQQMVEMVPFFVRPDLWLPEGQRALCRALHYLRVSPAWVMGNILAPHPMHLGERLIDDQLGILGVVD